MRQKAVTYSFNTTPVKTRQGQATALRAAQLVGRVVSAPVPVGCCADSLRELRLPGEFPFPSYTDSFF